MKHLYFCRHGQSQGNVDRILEGQLNSRLTALGKQQAHAAAELARGLAIEHILSSPLSRASETAQIIAGDIGYPEDAIEYLDLLMEANYGSAAGASYDTDFSKFTDMETDESLSARARQAFVHIQSLPQDNILVVGHSNFWQHLHKVFHPDQTVTSADEPSNGQIVQLL